MAGIEVPTELETLSKNIYDAVRLNSPQLQNPTQAQVDQLAAARTQAISDMKIMLTQIMAHLVGKMIIKEVAVANALDSVAPATDGRTVESFAAGAGSNHFPSLVTDLVSATGGPVTGSVKSDKLATGTGIQSNDGTGLVA